MNFIALHKTSVGRAVSGSWLAIGIILTSCEKVIDLEIPESGKQYVIEAVLSDAGCRVNVSQTLHFSDSNQYHIVSGAKISISEDGKTPVKLVQMDGGFYRANLLGRPGRSYALRVEINNKVFTATSVVPQKVSIDTLYIGERSFFGRTRKVAILEFNDPPGLGNMYRFISYVQTKRDNGIYITDDHLIDGRKVTYEMLVFDSEDDPLKAGDQLRVELLAITPFIYNYWYSLEQSALGQSQSASPGNPLNPFEAGAVGYFSTHTISSRSATIR